MVARVAHVLPALLTLLLGTAMPASAQRAVISVGHPGAPPATDLIDFNTGVVTRLTDDVTDKAVFLSDGTVLLRRKSGERNWRARFMASGVELNLPQNFLPLFFSTGSIAISHPRQLVVFGLYRDPVSGANSVSRFDAAGLVIWQPCTATQVFRSFDVSPDGSELLATCMAVGNSGESEVVVVDSANGATNRRLPFGRDALGPIAIGQGGAEFLVMNYGGLNRALMRVDAVTGEIRQSLGLDGTTAVEIVPDPRRRERPVLVTCSTSGACDTRALDFGMLATGPALAIGGTRPTALSFSADGRQVIIGGDAVVARADLSTGAVMNLVAAPPGGFIVAAWGAEPQAPALASALVTGTSVSLSWTLPEESTATTGYRLEAGTGPGLADLLTTDAGMATAFAASSVPAGRYYVRIRALNGNGVSAPSNEVVIDVP